MSATEQIINGLLNAMSGKGRKTPSAYDTPATVKRVEGSTAWIHIPGGVDETPVRLTIDAKAGDTVQVRISGGGAWIVGNATAPPTDDTKAKEAIKQAEEAAGTATKFVTDTNDGIFVHPKDNDGDGVRITDAIEILKSGLSYIRAYVDGGIAKVRVGRSDKGHSVIDSNGMRIYGGDGSALLANIGYGEGVSQTGTGIAPYFTFGTRYAGSDIGNMSFAEGSNNQASNVSSHSEGHGTASSGFGSHTEGLYTVAEKDGSHAEGWLSKAKGIASHAQNMANEALSDFQTVIGKYNATDANGVYGFIMGNGTNTGSGRSNGFAVKWDGETEIALNTSAAAGTVDGDLYAAVTALGWDSEVIV